MIHLIITAANIKENYSERKLQYIESIEQALQYKHYFDNYSILECNSKFEEYLENYNLHYSGIDNVYPEKGLNELQHLKTHILQMGLKQEDFVVKLTGRYLLEEGLFLDKVQTLISKGETDSIFKLDNDVYEGKGYHTFLYAINVGTFLQMFDSFSFKPENRTPIEWGVKDFLHGRTSNHLVDRLGLLARQGTFSENIFRS